MPIYEYACQSCGHEFELLVRSDTHLACPSCRSERLDKQLSVFATAESGSSGSSEPVCPATGFTPCGACGHPDGPGACHMH
jgi:putative FmdB family regulatory protein